MISILKGSDRIFSGDSRVECACRFKTKYRPKTRYNLKTRSNIILPWIEIKCLLVLFIILSLFGCRTVGSGEYERRRRTYDTSELEAAVVRPAASGSLWTGMGSAQHLFTDSRAFRPGDVVVIEIDERADAQRSADTRLSRDTETDAAVTAFLGALEMLRNSGIDPSIKASVKRSMQSSGSTGRSENLKATVPAMVRKVLPTGDLFVEGHRNILVNNEEQHFYISGIVRAIDIDNANTVMSSRIADAEIEFTGRGVLTDNQRQNLFHRLFVLIWPF